MIIDFQKTDSPETFDCDVAVVGAGAVGVLMAVDLARRGVDVMLIEGGGTRLEVASQELNEVVLKGREMGGLNEARYRYLGGSTNFWGGQIVRFDPIIFEPRPWIDSPGWPVKRAQMDPYYDRAARLMGLNDDFSDQELWQKIDSAAPDLGPDLEVFLTRCLLNRSTADVFRKELDGEDFTTLVHANVTGLLSDSDGTSVTGLSIRSLTGRTGTIRAKRVVLANGTVEISRLLLSPLADGRPAPWADNSWIGTGFIDHLEALAGKVSLLDKERFHHIFDNLYIDHIKYFPRVKLSDTGQRNSQIMDVAARFEFRSKYKEHLANMRLFVRSLLSGRKPDNLAQLPSHLAAVWKVAVPLAWRYLKANRAFNPSDAGIDFVMMSEQWPTADSTIRLALGKNALGMPDIEVNWAIDGREFESMAVFAEKARAAFQEQGLADIALDPALVGRDPAFMDKVMDYYHQMGGARIGTGPQDGVVDGNMKVFGTQNLYVGGAAVYGFSGFGNPTYTAMALGLRLCDHLTGEPA